MSSDRHIGHGGATAAMALGALGVVYGDIGTSPLFAFREAFHHAELDVRETTAFGIASLVFWSLVLVIVVKYLILVMRADNRGEGGILALTALVIPRRDGSGVRKAVALTGMTAVLVTLGVFGCGLLYGDGAITPAISVLAAVEGFEIATDAFSDWVIPVTIAILIGLFAVQKRGTASIARVFGPVMVVWFVTIGVLGLIKIIPNPEVLKSVWPGYAVEFFVDQPGKAFVSLGSVFLVLAGGEALYADMGHFGRRPIQLAFYVMVLPSLVLCYFGQAALVLDDPKTIENPFYRLAPEWMIPALAVLATMATVIASQALITGAYSLTSQAIQLDYLPRLAVHHTSAQHIGQIYVPLVNWLLMIVCVGLVLGFQTSSGLAAAYGIAIVVTMAITTMLFHHVARTRMGWSALKAGLVLYPLLAIDLLYLAANILKIPDGGWFPLLIAVILLLQMTTWRKGRDLVAARQRRAETPLAALARRLTDDAVVRVPGTAAYLFKDPGATPPALLVNLEHQKVIHERVLVVSVEVSEDATIVDGEDRVVLTEIGNGISQVVITHGFMEPSQIVPALESADLPGGPFNPGESTFFLGDELVIADEIEGMHPWREQLYVLLDRGADSASRFFDLPADRVVTVGTHVEI